ncbi:hypothetical protein KIPB_003223 [Kipferlia bialata]|uniref:Uncharacterized protein n=1 Tax=Kipferlia bialata TaxID=797122 RepID=A0A9K3GGI8_9EUKA|nr:hypothetical protein KIPB_003223 [Kipferlia bialata]|eukprot:g3223.t1
MEWFTECKVLPGIGEGGKTAVDISLASIGHNMALVAYHYGTHSPMERWAILSLTKRGTIKTQSIAGPPNPHGVFGMQLCRVGEVVVAYGGSVSSDGRRRGGPACYMAVYYIDTDRWQRLPYKDGECPEPRRYPLVFSVGDSLVVAGGWVERKANPQDTWVWSLETRLWTQVGDCPADLHNTGATHGTSHHIYTRCNHYVYSGTKKEWSEERGHVANGIYPNSFLHTPLYGECQLLATRLSKGFGKGRQRVVILIRDSVSLDRTTLEYLPLSDYQYSSLGQCVTAWFNPCTLLVVGSEMICIVEVDASAVRPYVLFEP